MPSRVRPTFLIGALLFAAACATEDAAPVEDADVATTFSFVADAPVDPGQEMRLCFRFDASALARGDIVGVSWAPAVGPVVVHHATLFAGSGDGPEGAFDCGAMDQDIAVLHVYTPGSAELGLPDDVAVELPAFTKSVVVQAHLLRFDWGAPPPSSVTIAMGSRAHQAAWLDVRAPVPAIPPGATKSSIAGCSIAAPLTIVSAWPHMHQIGTAFHGAVLHTGGASEPTVDVDPWEAGHQPMYPVAIDVAAGEAVQTECVWHNAGDSYVLPGLGWNDEMCNQGLFAWPAASARCAH